MHGWVWASFNDVADLFYYYGVSPKLELFQELRERDSTWASAFFADGWRSTERGGDDFKRIDGFLSDVDCADIPPFFTNVPCTVAISDRTYSGGDDTIFSGGYPFPRLSSLGAWFYRSPSAVPLPSGLGLVLFGLLVLRRFQVTRAVVRPEPEIT